MKKGCIRGAGYLIVVTLLMGCSSGSMDDLQAYVDEVKASRKGKVPPLPEFTPVESFTYSVANKGDPFVSWEAKAASAVKQEKKAKKGGGLQPDMTRRREPLESFPLDTLRMVGTLQRENESSALVRSPDGLVSRVVVGNYVGQNHGRVVSILPDRMELMEIVPDGLGGWQHRPASLVIVEAAQ